MILIAADKSAVTERYRSGHNEAVLKTVCPEGRVGSNPTLSAGVLTPRSIERNPILRRIDADEAYFL